jgi:hypothetical protein
MTRSAYRIEAMTAARIRGRVYRQTEVLVDGITLPSEAQSKLRRFAADRPDALVSIVAYAVPA